MKRFGALCQLLFIWAVATSAMAQAMGGRVIAVIDGDTVLFKPDHHGAASRSFLKLRLADIDAPEHDQPYGDAATAALSALLLNRRVTLETVATDVYGRTIARIRIGAMELDAALVRNGFAWAAARSRRSAGLLEAQHDARRARRGLWQDPAPIPPWEWRRARATAAGRPLSR